MCTTCALRSGARSRRIARGRRKFAGIADAVFLPLHRLAQAASADQASGRGCDKAPQAGGLTPAPLYAQIGGNQERPTVEAALGEAMWRTKMRLIAAAALVIASMAPTAFASPYGGGGSMLPGGGGHYQPQRFGGRMPGAHSNPYGNNCRNVPIWQNRRIVGMHRVCN